MSCLLVSPFLMYLGLAQTGLGQTIVISYAILIHTLACEMDVIGMFSEWKRFGSLKPSLTLGTVASAVCLALAITFGFVYPDIATFERATPQTIAQHAPPPPDIFDYQDAPSRERLAALADSYWPGSRIVICGKRLTEVVYPDEEQTRFRPMEEFSPDEFVELAANEQLNLLVPPDDGRFYDADSPLADIHANGASYLFPVANLPGGWQLWRSIPPPQSKQ